MFGATYLVNQTAVLQGRGRCLRRIRKLYVSDSGIELSGQGKAELSAGSPGVE
jgi:hypothetical protein